MTTVESNVFATRITALRQAMKKHQFDAYVVPSSDAHISEYQPEHWQARQWLSGFDGSAGTLVVTQDFAGLWTDSRYWGMAEHQLKGSGINLQKFCSPETSHQQWLVNRLPENSTVGIDGSVLSVAENELLSNILLSKKIKLDTTIDLLEKVWADRPELPLEAVYSHNLSFCAFTCQDKLAQLRQVLQQKNTEWHLLSSMEDIAWLTNLRGNDVNYNPVFIAYMLIGAQEALLFINEHKLPAEVRQELEMEGITIMPYEAIDQKLAEIEAGSSILFDPKRTNIKRINALSADVTKIEDINPTALFKSCKHEKDLQHIRHAMEEDGAALCEFFAWLETAVANKEPITELTIDEKLIEFRSKKPYYVCPSFSTIAGFNANGAMPHYRATENNHAAIEGDGLLLIDSGAQYLDGTTDITRVVAIGNISAEQKRDFTLVLKAHIALGTAVFPENIAAPLLDAITRAPLWAEQIDFGHGTGHGVGYFLNVHEGPQVLSYHAPITSHSAMKAGMVTSNEPGLYRPGKWGIRLENLVANIEMPQPVEQEFGRFLCFETLTLCPFDVECIDVNYLTDKELEWLNNYHQQVYARLAPKIKGAALAWLKDNTRPIERS